MRAGRNELCPCGSGKKYKKCCLAKDQDATAAELEAKNIEIATAAVERERAFGRAPERPAATEHSAAPPPPPDPHMQAINARWEQFEAADDVGRRELFLKTLDEPELMDDEMAFNMLDPIYLSAIKAGERDRFDELIDRLRERVPDVYEKGRKYFLNWRITNAVVAGRSEAVLSLSRELAETAGDDADNYDRVVDLLAYHGQLDALAAASRIAWPLIQSSDNILWGQGEFASWSVDCLLFERLERGQELNGRDPELIEQVRVYYENLQVGFFAQYVKHLSGRASRVWSLADFQGLADQKRKKRRRSEEDEDDEKNEKTSDQEALAYLVDEFLHYARREEGVSYTKAALARKNITRYILDRLAGELEPKESLVEAMMRRTPKPKPKPRVPDHLLCPDGVTLDRYFAELLHFMNPQHYDVAATFELLPTWLRFLESRGLIEPARRESTLAEIGHLQPTLLKLWEDGHRDDPTLAERLRHWPESAEKR